MLSLHEPGMTDTMSTPLQKTALFGELVEAAFEQAEQFSSDPDEVSRLASKAVMRLLLRQRKVSRVFVTPAACA